MTVMITVQVVMDTVQAVLVTELVAMVMVTVQAMYQYRPEPEPELEQEDPDFVSINSF